MDRPIAKKTALCLALAASLAFFGNYASAYEYSTEDGVSKFTSDSSDSISSNIFTDSGGGLSGGETFFPDKGAIIEINGSTVTGNLRGVYITSAYDVGGDIDITIGNLSAGSRTFYGLEATASATAGDIKINLSGSEINVVYGAFYHGNSTTDLATAPFSVGNISINMAGGSGSYIYALRIGNYTTDGAENTIGAISVALSDSAAISGDVFGYYTNSTTAIPNTKTTIDSISITETSSSVEGTIYGIDHVNQSTLEITGGVTISLTDSDVSRIFGAYSTGGTVKITDGITITMTGGEVVYYGTHLSNINGFYLYLNDDSLPATAINDIGAITITVSDSGGSGSFYGYSSYTSTSTFSDTTIGSITMSVTNVAAESNAERTVGGVLKLDNGSLTIGEGGITVSSIDSASYTVFGISSAGGNVTINGDIRVTLINKEGESESSAHGLVYGAYLSGGADDVEFTTKDIYVDVEGAFVENAGSIYGVRVNGNYAGDVTFNSGNITIKMVGDETTSSIYGYDINPESETKVTSVVGIISLDVSGGAESGSFYGYYSGGDVSAESDTQIKSIDVTVSGLDLEEGSFAGTVSGVHKQDPGALTVGDVTVTTSSAADTYVRGIFSSAGAVTVNGNVSVTTSSTTDSHVQGVYIGGGTFNITGNIILTLTDLNMPSTATDENIEGFRFGGDGTATLNGSISITAIADPNINGDGFDHDIIGAAIVYNSAGSVTQTGDITITIGGENKDLNLTGTIYGLVDATGSNSYTLNGTTKLVFGGDTAFVSDDDESALKGTFANFKEVVISSGSSLFIASGTDFQGELSGDMDVFGSTGRPDDKYITDIYSENGILTLSEKDNKLTIESEGQAYIEKLVNAGTVADEGDLTITKGSNSGTISGNGELVLGTPSNTSETFISTGTIDIPTFTLGKDATLDEREGTVTVKTKADLTAAGYMAIGAPATAELNVDGTINAQVSVQGKLAIGEPDDFKWVNEALSGANLSADSNILALKSLVTTGSSGYITVGNGVSVLSASDTPGLNFGTDSVLVVDAGKLTVDDLSSSAFTTTASGATVTVDSSGTVVLYGSISKGRYNITSGYDYDGDIEGWYKPTIDDSDDYVKVVDSSGVTWNYYRGSDEQDGVKYVFIETTSHDPSSENYPDINIPNIVDDDLDACKDGDYVCGILRNSDLTNDEKTEIINSSSTLLFDGGVTAVARDGAGMAMDRLYNHLTMDSDTFDKDAKLWQYEESNNIWLDTMGGWSKAKSLFTATGLSRYGYRNHSFGIIGGFDHKFEDRPFVLGVAFSIETGTLKSRGHVDATKNEYENYGVHIFGNYSENEHLNLIGSLHWLHNNSGVKQSTGVSEFSTASASMHTDTYAAGLRAETMIKAGDVNIIPHVEGRYMYGKTRGFDTKVNGSKVWRTKANGTHTLQVPFGVAFRTDKKFDNGWNLRPNIDLQAIPQIGNTKQKTVVTDYNGVSDIIVGQFAGKWAGQARVGFQADKKNATVGAHYSFLGGNKGRAGHTFIVQGRVRF